jgi:hypothetical protein
MKKSVSISDKTKKTMVLLSMAFIITVIFNLVWFGYNVRHDIIRQCEVESVAYVTAEFSETYPETYIGADGYIETTIETDYWTEAASDVYVFITINGALSESHGVLNKWSNEGWAIPAMPSHWAYDKNLRNRYDFDRYKFHLDTKLTVNAVSSEDYEDYSFTESTNKNLLCISKVDETVEVKTWWGISYGSDF